MSPSDVGRTRYRPAVIEDAPSHPGSRPAYALATGLVAARWLIVAGWAAATVLALLLLPPLTTRSGGSSGITPHDNPANGAGAPAAQDLSFPVPRPPNLLRARPASPPPAGSAQEA